MNPNSFNPGSILINTTTNKLYGVLVSHLPNNKIIVFRLDKNTHPIFSKFELHEHIAKVGIINESQYSNLKSALLKHYRTYNLTPTEKKMLQPLMNFAFPLGIPEYQPDIDLPERDIQMMDLNSKLIRGNRVFIHTPGKSCYSHLDGKIVNIMEKTPEGLWVNLPSGEHDLSKLGNSLYFLYYKNPDIPTFSGISRIVPITDRDGSDDGDVQIQELPEYYEAFNQLRDANNLVSTMIFNGDKVRILPNTKKIIFPEIYQGMIYNSHDDTFNATADIVSTALSKKLGDKLHITEDRQPGSCANTSNTSHTSHTSNTSHTYLGNPDNEIIFSRGDVGNGADSRDAGRDDSIMIGGALSKKQLEHDLADLEHEEMAQSRLGDAVSSGRMTEVEPRNIDDLIEVNDITDDNINESRKLRKFADDDDEFQEFLQGSRLDDLSGFDKDTDPEEDNSERKHKSDTASGFASGDETEYDEDTVEIIDDSDVEELDVFHKVKIQEVDKLEKVYKESIQRGDLYNYKIEQIPKLLQQNDEIRNKINKEINIISLLKNHLTGADKNILFQPQDYKPLVSKYINGDFTNKFIIPLVINQKRIYIDKNKKINADDFDPTTCDVNDNYFGQISNMIYLQNKKNTTINHDTYNGNIITEMNPNMVREDDNLGLLFRLGENISNDDYAKLQQDTLTIRYCDKPMKCQSYSLNAMNFDYQVNLGPIGRFINDEDNVVPDTGMGGMDTGATGASIGVLEDDSDERVDKDILYTKPRFTIYYQGDLIRIIGYIRPPLNYFNIKTDTELTVQNQKEQTGISGILANIYRASKNKDEVITINLEDINPDIIDEENGQFDITIHPDKFIIFLLPHDIKDSSNLENHLGKIIPGIDDIIKLYLNKKTGNPKEDNDQYNVNEVYNILEKFDYDYREITLDMQNKIWKHMDNVKELYSNFNTEISRRYKEYLKNKKEQTEKKNDKQESKQESKKDRFKYIPDEILEDIGKFYYKTYENKDIAVDSDDIRLRWFMNNFDNGQYFFKTLFMNYLKMYEESNKIENLETELAMLKDKHTIMMNSNPEMGSGSSAVSLGLGGSGICNSKDSGAGSGPNIIKYPNIGRLEADNGKVAVDSEGVVIMPGDYALVDVEGIGKQLYKRDIVANVDMWIKDDLAALYKIIQDKKNKCINNPEMKLEDAGKCTFNLENIRCEFNEQLDTTKHRLESEKTIADIQRQIDYIRRIPGMIANLNREIASDRSILLNKLNAEKRYWREREEDERRLDEAIQKTIYRSKPCKHFEITDYFFKFNKYSDDRYQFAQSILRTFQNTDPEFIHDYHIFNPQKPDSNYTYCNICNQTLLCNHIRLGISFLEDGLPIDYDQIIRIYGNLVDGGYNCRVCGEFIDNTEVKDLEEYAHGEDGYKIKTRELNQEDPLIEKQKKYIDKMITRLLEGPQDSENTDLQMKMNIYKLLKQLCGIGGSGAGGMMAMDDEIHMVNFLKSYNFISKTVFIQKLAAKLGTGNIALIRKQTEQFYLIYICCDIAARLLILLQTSKTVYELRNKDCPANIIGFPLINDLDALDGVNFMMCLLFQMSVLPEYNPLSSLKVDILITQIKKQVDEDNFIRNRIYNALNQKEADIDYIYKFRAYHTNYWKSYMPQLQYNPITWTPEKIIGEHNLDEITSKNWVRMVDVARENGVFYSLDIINRVNYIIDNADKPSRIGILSMCCGTRYMEGQKYDYMKYFADRDSEITRKLKHLKEAGEIAVQLYDIRRDSRENIIYEPLYKPSQMVFKFNLDVDGEQIRDIYLKFIDTGINKGKIHIYDKFGRCVLSNERREEIAMKTYSQHDYKRIEDAITTSNQIDIAKYVKTAEVITPRDLEVIYLRELRAMITPHSTGLKYLGEYLDKILESLDEIYSSGISISGAPKPKPKPGADFNINRHLASLKSQIETEINSLVSRIANTDKMVDKYYGVLNNIGYYKNLYDEYRENENHSDFQSELYRYNKQETTIQGYLKFLNEIFNQIKNNKLSNPLDKERTRPQYREFLQFGANIGLFKTLSKPTRHIYTLAEKIKSKHYYKILFPEMTANILHYLIVISLANLFDVIDNSHIKKRENEMIDYKFQNTMGNLEARDPALMEYTQNMDLDINRGMAELLSEDVVLDEDGVPVDMIESFEIKNSTNIKMVGSFILTFLDYIDDQQQTYDGLTLERIAVVMAEEEQKRVETTLRNTEWLAKEGNEEIRQLVRIQKKLERVDYKNLNDYLVKEYGDDFARDQDADDEYDPRYDRDLRGDGEGDDDRTSRDDDNFRRGNDYGMDEYELDNEIPELVAMEDMEGGDMDYNYLGVDDN